ncbi:Glucoamylase, intracellular sporulation-specific [Rhizina undulata]
MVLLNSILFPLLGASFYTQLSSAYAVPEHKQTVPHKLPQKPLLHSDENASPEVIRKDLEQWILQQRSVSFERLLSNIGPSGTEARGTAPGTVIASPSKQSPNYFYQWVRDAAITMAGVVNEYTVTDDSMLQDVIERYMDLQGLLQGTENPSGGYNTGGLGEPKFMVDGTPFIGNWGRPQRDGPALRAITLMSYIKAVNATRPITEDWITRFYDSAFPTHSIIKADLEYISHAWHEIGFDLWEEISDLHFFTAMVQHKALVQGRDLALALGDFGGAKWYDIQSAALKDFLKTSFWDAEKGHLKAMFNTKGRNGLDCALLLGAIHGSQDDVFPPWSDEILVSMHKLIQDMGTRHPINMQRTPFYPEEDKLRGVGIGRYPEDVYDGVGFGIGNPWFLCTSSVSDVLYDSIIHFKKQGYFEINDVNIPFYHSLASNGKAVVGRYTAKQPEYKQYLNAMFTYADSFLNVIRWHATADGRLSEQFHRVSGFQMGARDLTWSYGSFIEAVEKRTVARKALLEGLN